MHHGTCSLIHRPGGLTNRSGKSCAKRMLQVASCFTHLVLHTFGENVASCFTHLPLRSPPVPNQERREIAIAHVGNHFVQVFLHPHDPVPPMSPWWGQHSSYEAKGWAARYRTRVHLWYEVIGTSPSVRGAEFGGNIY